MAVSKKRKSNKIKKVMHEYKMGTLKSSSGKKVKSRKQAIKIALSEAERLKDIIAERHNSVTIMQKMFTVFFVKIIFGIILLFSQ